MAEVIYNLISNERQVANVAQGKLKHKVGCKEDKAGSRNNAGAFIRQKNCIKRFNGGAGKEEGVNRNRPEESLKIEERREQITGKEYNRHHYDKNEILNGKRFEFLIGQDVENLHYKEKRNSSRNVKVDCDVCNYGKGKTAEHFYSVAGKGRAFVLIFEKAVEGVKYKKLACYALCNHFGNGESKKIKNAESQKGNYSPNEN